MNILNCTADVLSLCIFPLDGHDLGAENLLGPCQIVMTHSESGNWFSATTKKRKKGEFVFEQDV